MDATITFKDGTTHIYQGVPSGTAPDVVEAQALKDFGKPVASLSGGAAPAAAPSPAPAPRWDIPGDIGRAAEASAEAIPADLKASMPNPQDIQAGHEANRTKYGAVGGTIADIADSGKRALSLAKVPLDAAGVVASPVTGLIHGTLGSALSYITPTPAKDTTINGTTYYADPKKAADQIIDSSMIGLGPRGVGSADAVEAGAADAVKANAARDAAVLKNRAIDKVNARATVDYLTAQQVLDAQKSATASGDNVTLMDLGNKNVRGLAGAVYRAPGPAGKAIDDFLEARDKAASDALTGDVGSSIGQGSTFQAIKDLYQARSAAAAPLFEDAFKADSTAPLESQYRSALISATGAKGAAGADVRARYMDLHAQLQQAETDRQAWAAKYQKAQADGTANAPGAVWSPRLQQFMDNPEVQSGLKSALKLEKQDAITEGRPFKDSDYSIVGQDANGDPVLGEVPTMKSLAVAKEGLDARVAELKDPKTGRPTKAGLSLKKFRDAFVNELDTLNPKYKVARDAWSGPSQTVDAVNEGKQHFSRPDSNQQIKAEFDALTSSDKEFYRMGAAEAKIDQLERAPDASDKSKRIINSERDRKRFRILLSSDAEADNFMNSVARKRAAFETKTAVKGNSATAGRQIEDAAEDGVAGEVGRGAVHAVSGNWLGAAKAAFNAKRQLGMRNNPALNSEIAKLLTDPNLAVSGQDNVLARLPVPRGANYFAKTGAANALLSSNRNRRSPP